jgi:hypothetical protein
MHMALHITLFAKVASRAYGAPHAKNTASDFFGSGVSILVGKRPNPSTLQNLCRLRVH